MAYIAFSQGKWRAQVQKLGVRSSKGFATKEEAERWAEQAAATYEDLGDRLGAYVRLDMRAWKHLR